MAISNSGSGSGASDRVGTEIIIVISASLLVALCARCTALAATPVLLLCRISVWYFVARSIGPAWIAALGMFG
jgi:hypothetical protein